MKTIKRIQLDINGLCNAGCWFCTVRYLGNPIEYSKNMDIDLLEKILKNLYDERELPNGLIDSNLNFIYASHYNEFLLYNKLEEFLSLLRKYKFTIYVLSNGTPLIPSKIDLLLKYKDVISGITFNIPAFEKELWSKRVNLPENLFDNLIRNLNYWNEVHPLKFSIQINGLDPYNQYVKKGNNFNLDISYTEIDVQYNIATKLFPNNHIFKQTHLVDRAETIKDIILNEKYSNGKVIGCNNGMDVGGRMKGWLHINSLGETFICCDDYHMEYKFGDFKTMELKEFWNSEEHRNIMKKAGETLCKKCIHAVFEG